MEKETNDASQYAGFLDKIPDEILQEILKRVPRSSMKNCLLVSKKFNRESINATRNKWKITIDEEALESGDALLNTDRLFDEVSLMDINCAGFSLFNGFAEKFFVKFGLRIKKLSVFDLQMAEKDLFTILSFMPNLVELRLGCGRLIDNASTSKTTSSHKLEFTKLKRIDLVDSTWSFIEKLSCPSLTSFSFKAKKGNYGGFDDDDNFNDDDVTSDYRPLYRFLRRHMQINDIILRFGFRDPFVTSDFSVDHLKLKRFQFFRPSLSAPLPYSFLNKQHKLKTLDYQEEINDETLRQIIVECPDLERFTFSIRNEPISEETVKKLLEMKSLKKLRCGQVNKEFFENLAKIGSKQIKGLLLWPISTYSIPIKVAKDLGTQFPNVLTFEARRWKNPEAAFVTAQQMKKLYGLALQFDNKEEINFPEDVRLPTVRTLQVLKWNCHGNQLRSLVKITPNLENLCMINTDIELDWTFLSFPKLIRLQFPIKTLIKPSVVEIILKREPKLNMIMAINARASDDINRLVEVYCGEFPKIKRHDNIIVMSCN